MLRTVRPGPDTITVFPEITVTSSDDFTPERVPDLTAGVVIGGCWVYPVSATEGQALGQSTATVYDVVVADFPGGAWAMVAWAGRDWDVVGEPERFNSGRVALTTLHMSARTPKAVS